MDGPSLLEAGTRIQSEIAIDDSGQFLSLERIAGCDTLCVRENITSQGRNMPPLLIAAAQSTLIAGDLAGNIARHQRFMQVAAGVLITENGYSPDTALLKGYAQNHSMVVLMANHGGATGGWESAGRSAIWSENGSLIAAAPGTGDLMVVARRDTGGWSGQVVPVMEA
jgi:hypothetical protein